VLGVRTYPREYIDGIRSKVEADVAAYRNLVSGDGYNGAIPTFEGTFFNNLLLVLDNAFVHRLRVVEGKDGNALNETRLLSNSLLNDGGPMTLDKAIKYTPEKAVLKYQPGDAIRLSEADFERLCAAFFSEIESKFA
jgi:hypothetical protein